jgi:hypothetical protein
LRRCIEDADFRSTFADDEAVKAHSPVTEKTGLWRSRPAWLGRAGNGPEN